MRFTTMGIVMSVVVVFVMMRIRVLIKSFLAVKNQEVHAERIKSSNKNTR